MYEVRWSNGFWKLFDTERYCTEAVFGLRKEAFAALQKINAAGKVGRK